MNAAALILGGGAGTRLQPLTSERAKPAVPIGGKYRLVDIPISNCIHSGLRKIFLLTQFNSVSLHQHVQGAFKFDDFAGSFVRILAAQQTPGSEAWFNGTADAVRKTFGFFSDRGLPDYVVILSGDQLYRMNFREVIEQHAKNGAEVTICTKPVPREQAGDLGIMHINERKEIVTFKEKPGDGPALDELRAPIYDEERFLASMGIYVFNTRVTHTRKVTSFPLIAIEVDRIQEPRGFSHVFDGYWRYIGTIDAFLEANLELTDSWPEFDLYNHLAPIYTRMRYLPPSKITHCELDRALVTEGGIVNASRIQHAIIGQRAVVGEGSVIENSYLMGADFYDQEVEPHQLPLGVGKNCVIKNAIIDKNARIGDNVVISPEGKQDEERTDHYWVRSGVIVIPKATEIPANTVL